MEVVVFDLGKVLVDFDYGIAARRIAGASQAQPGDIRSFIDQSPLLLKYETGLMTRQEFFEEIRQRTGFRESIETFAGYFADVFSPIDRMIALHGALRKNGVPTFIFSNTNDLAVDHIRRNFPFFSEFNDHVLSYEHGAMKPDPKLYEVVERMTGRKSSEIIYLDDRLENIETGQARGWRTIHHQTPEASIAQVRAWKLVGEF